MSMTVDRLMQEGCQKEKSEKLCRARGGESCAFDGAMIVLQPIADAAHVVHGPIACCGNSWEGRGSLSSKGDLHRQGFTTDLNEMDIVYGSEDKLYRAILKAVMETGAKAIFVHATCVSGLIGEDMEAVCRKAEMEAGVSVIPVNAPGFIGPKNLGNRIAGEVLLERVIGTGSAPAGQDRSSFFYVNLIGEYNIAGDLRLVEPVLNRAGIKIQAGITGNSTMEEIRNAHHAQLNMVVCSRALINVAREMERRYGIPYVEVSFFGETEMTKALRAVGEQMVRSGADSSFPERIEEVIASERQRLQNRLGAYSLLQGKKAVLYSGGVKSWSFISALMDLGIEVVAVGAKKSSAEDEEKMKKIMGRDAPIVEDVTPGNLLRLLKERGADMLVAGGRNKYLAVKEGYPFIDVNQERESPYAGYEGLINIARDLSSGIRFYERRSSTRPSGMRLTGEHVFRPGQDLVINPLKHSQALGAAIAFQGIHRAVPILHGAQGCNFLGKVLLTSHFREPISLVSSKMFVEDVVMGSEEILTRTIDGLIAKNSPEVIGVLTTGLSEVRGDDIRSDLKSRIAGSSAWIIPVSTPDYEGGLETGYAKALEAVIDAIATKNGHSGPSVKRGQINVLTGSCFTPADFMELRETIEAFGLRAIMIPDLAALDGSRKGVSTLALGGVTAAELEDAANTEFTIAIGAGMELPARKIKESFGIEYKLFDSLCGLENPKIFLETLSMISGMPTPKRFDRQRMILADALGDAHFYTGGKKACIALEPDHAVVMSGLLDEMGTTVIRAVIPQYAASASSIRACETIVGDLNSVGRGFDILISNSHAAETAGKLEVPLYQTGFPVNRLLGATSRVTVGYRGTLNTISEIGNLLMTAH
jgi:nitrogenase molybdenum-cofactor synthesis protein NifE